MTPIQDYINTYPNPKTRKTYTTCLCRFFEAVYRLDHPPPNTRVDFSVYEPLAAQYLAEVRTGRNARNDLLLFVSSLSTVSPITQRVYPNHIMAWLEFHGLPVPASDRKMVFRRTRPPVPASEEEYITHEILQRILQFSPPQLQVLIYFMASTGVRIDEALNVEVGDLDLTGDPVMVHIRPEIAKGGVGRWTFLTSECREILTKWMEYRDTYLEKKRGPRAASSSREDFRIFPFNDSAALDMWTHALDRAGLCQRDRVTNRLTIHPHGLRKFFRRTLPTGGNNAKAVELTEKLMGHAGYLGGVYSRVPLSELAAFYREAEHVLWINQPVAVRDPEIERRLELTRKENEGLRSRLFDIETNQAEMMASWKKMKEIMDGNPDIGSPPPQEREVIAQGDLAGTRTESTRDNPPPAKKRHLQD